MRYRWQGIATAVHARGIGARVGAEVGGAVPWVPGMEWVARAGTCRGSARGSNAGWKVPRQGCWEGVCGCAGHSRGIDGWARAACRGKEQRCAHSLDRDRTQSERAAPKRASSRSELAPGRISFCVGGSVSYNNRTVLRTEFRILGQVGQLLPLLYPLPGHRCSSMLLSGFLTHWL